MQDANFNVLSIVDDTGAMIERYEYTPYGQRMVYFSSGSADPQAMTPTLIAPRVELAGVAQPYALNPMGHQGLMHDEATSLIYNRARMLHPRLGRFIQRDPLGYVDGMSGYAGYHVMHGGADPSGSTVSREFVTLRAGRWSHSEGELFKAGNGGVVQVGDYIRTRGVKYKWIMVHNSGLPPCPATDEEMRRGEGFIRSYGPKRSDEKSGWAYHTFDKEREWTETSHSFDEFLSPHVLGLIPGSGTWGAGLGIVGLGLEITAKGTGRFYAHKKLYIAGTERIHTCKCKGGKWEIEEHASALFPRRHNKLLVTHVKDVYKARRVEARVTSGSSGSI